MTLMLSPHKKTREKVQRCKQKDGASFHSLPHDCITPVRAKGPHLWMPLHELFRQEAGSCPADEVGFVATDGPGPFPPEPWETSVVATWCYLHISLGFQAMIVMWGVSETFSVSHISYYFQEEMSWAPAMGSYFSVFSALLGLIGIWPLLRYSPNHQDAQSSARVPSA